jgi:2-(1,2-epoxy-1,2-dihydrophenyl)acetyl-CoA isomerase
MIQEYPHVETERRGLVMIIRLDNAAARNALSREMRMSLRDITRVIEDDASIRSVYLTGKGASFCAGGDLTMLTNASEPWQVHRRFRHAHTLFPPLAMLDRPVVCGVRGHAVGGGLGLALMSDLVVAGKSAKFTAGFFRLGVVPDCLSLFTLPRLIGLGRTRNFLYADGVWDAQTAVDLGVALKMVPDDDVDATGIALAEKLAAGPAQVMGLAKQLLLKSFESSLQEMMSLEGYGQVLAMAGPEFREGLAALLEKRAPDHQQAALDAHIGDGMPSFLQAAEQDAR